MLLDRSRTRHSLCVFCQIVSYCSWLPPFRKQSLRSSLVRPRWQPRKCISSVAGSLVIFYSSFFEHIKYLKFMETSCGPVQKCYACAHHDAVNFNKTGSTAAQNHKRGFPPAQYCGGMRSTDCCLVVCCIIQYTWPICIIVLMLGCVPRSSHFPRKAILNSVQITEQLLLSPTQTRSFFGSYWRGSE